MRRAYSLNFAGRLGSELVTMVLILIGVYLAEELVGKLHVIANVNAGLLKVPYVMALTAPEVLDFAMPLALVAAVYRVLLRLREQRELIALASASIGFRHLVGTLFLFAALCSALTIFASGYLEPTARHAQRSLIFSYYYQFIRNGILPERFLSMKNYTLYAREREADGSLRRIFIYERNDGARDRVITARQSRLGASSRHGTYALELGEVSAHLLPEDGAGVRGLPEISQVARLNRDLSLDGLISFRPRAEFMREWTLPELLGIRAPPPTAHRSHQREGLELLFHAALCLFAPVIAIFGVALTRGATHVIALPAICGIMLGLDIAGQALAKELVPVGDRAAWVLIVLGLFLVVLAWMAATFATREGALLRPRLDEA